MKMIVHSFAHKLVPGLPSHRQQTFGYQTPKPNGLVRGISLSAGTLSDGALPCQPRIVCVRMDSVGSRNRSHSIISLPPLMVTSCPNHVLSVCCRHLNDVPPLSLEKLRRLGTIYHGGDSLASNAPFRPVAFSNSSP